jgi:hypothetical protein
MVVAAHSYRDATLHISATGTLCVGVVVLGVAEANLVTVWVSLRALSPLVGSLAELGRALGDIWRMAQETTTVISGPQRSPPIHGMTSADCVMNRPGFIGGSVA